MATVILLVLFASVIYVSFAAGPKYPLKDSFNLPEDIEIAEENYLCNLNITKKMTNRLKCCECIKDCMKYENCCIDISWNADSPVRSQEYLDLFINVTNRYEDTNCESVLPVLDNNGKNHTSETIFLVSTCLNHASYIDKEGCRQSIGTSYDSILPVFGSDQYIYKNSFCARCNFVKEFELVNLTAYCKKLEKEYENPYQRFINCSFKIFRSETVKNYIKTCNKNIFDTWMTCNKTNKYDICSSYLGIVGSIANYHCLLCNESNTNISSKKSPKFVCPKKLERKSKAKDIDPNANQLWSFAIKFGEQTNITIKGIDFSSKTFCKNGEVFNFISSTCEKFSCPKGYKKSTSRCYREKIVSQNLTRFNNNTKFSRCFPSSNLPMIKNNVTNHSNENKAATNDVRILLKMILHQLKFYLKVNEGKLYHQISLNINQDQLKRFQNTSARSNFPIWIDIKKISLLLLPLKHFKNFSEIEFTKYFKGSCAKVKIVEKIPNEFMKKCFYKIQNKAFNFSTTNFLAEINKVSWTRKLISCLEFHLHSDCPLTPVADYMLLNNNTLEIESILYNVPLNESFTICIPVPDRRHYFVPPYKWLERLSKALRYISISGIIVSIICYFTIIIIYHFIKEMKSLPSTLIVLQCATLLVTDAAFIIALQIRRYNFACKLFGIFLHWALVAAHLWTVIIPFDLLSKVRSVSAGIRKADSVRLAKYCLTVYLTPTVMVGTLVVLDKYQVVDMGYGENDICFIEDFHSKLYFFSVPIAALFLTTISLLLYTLYCIKMKKKKARRVLQTSARHNNNLLLIALKLIIALGLVDMIGSIQIRKKNLSENELLFNSVFLLLFVTFRSLRGLWLFFIYVCSRRKFKLLKSIVKRSVLSWSSETAVRRCFSK